MATTAENDKLNKASKFELQVALMQHFINSQTRLRRMESREAGQRERDAEQKELRRKADAAAAAIAASLESFYALCSMWKVCL